MKEQKQRTWIEIKSGKRWVTINLYFRNVREARKWAKWNYSKGGEWRIRFMVRQEVYKITK